MTPTLTGLTINPDGTLLLTGTNLASVNSASFLVDGTSGSPTALSVGTTTATSIVVGTASLVAGTVYDFVVSNAQATSTPLAVTFTLPSGVIVTPASCSASQVLTYNGSAWTCVTPGGGGGTNPPVDWSSYSSLSSPTVKVGNSAASGTAIQVTQGGVDFGAVPVRLKRYLCYYNPATGSAEIGPCTLLLKSAQCGGNCSMLACKGSDTLLNGSCWATAGTLLASGYYGDQSGDPTNNGQWWCQQSTGGDPTIAITCLSSY